MHAACTTGDHTFLLEYVDAYQASRSAFDFFDNIGWGLLHHAVHSNRTECVRILLTVDNFNVRHRSNTGQTALLLAIAQNSSTDIVKLLIDADPSLVDTADGLFTYPMHLAVAQNQYDVVVTLVESLQSKNLPIADHVNANGETSLMLAARNTNLRMITYLLENTVHNCKQLCHRHNNALSHAVRRGHNHVDLIPVIEKLFPATYNMPLDNLELHSDSMLLLKVAIIAKNYRAVDWYVDNFYLSERNQNRALVRQLLDHFNSVEHNYRFHNIILTLHWRVSTVLLGGNSSTILYNDLYSDCFQIYLANVDLFKAISKLIVPKFQQKRSLPLSMFRNFFKRHINNTLVPQSTTNDIRSSIRMSNLARCLEFFDHFRLHTDREINRIVMSEEIMLDFVRTKVSMKQTFVDELFALLLPFYPITASSDILITHFFYGVMLLEEFRFGHFNRATETLSIAHATKCATPSTLYDLCRIRVRKEIFEKMTTTSKRKRFDQLKTLDVPRNVKNFLRYNETNYALR